jgi:drug/metabolite transporter (DMT)-like permease
LSFGDALIKLSSGNFVIWQIFVLRSAIAIPCLVAFMMLKAPATLRLPTSVLWTAFRSLLLVVMWISYYVALPHMSLSAAAAAYYTLPIFITLFSAAFVGDRVSRLGWLSVLLGFVGVLLILKPDVNDFNGYTVLPLFSAMLYAIAMILTRTKCQEEAPLLLALALNLTFVLVGIIATGIVGIISIDGEGGFLLAPWAAMGGAEWSSMLLLAIAVLIGSVGTAIAYQKGPSSVIGVFDFAYVGFAVVWSVLFFSELPDGVSVLGMGLIVLAGVLSLRR